MGRRGPQSPELIERRIAPLRGRPLSQEHRDAIGRANLGRVRSDVAKWAPERFAKFTKEQAATIRAEYAAGGVSMRYLAGVWGCDHTTIARVIRRDGPQYAGE